MDLANQFQQPSFFAQPQPTNTQGETDMTEELGPVEYMIVSFEGNRFKGEIIPALTRILDLGLIRVLDVAIVSKDKEGNFKATEETDLNDDVAVALANYYGKSTELLTQEDLIKAA
jgi:hypothetical protein